MIHSARSGSMWEDLVLSVYGEMNGSFKGWIRLICVFGGLKMFKLKACSKAGPTGISSALSISVNYTLAPTSVGQ